MHNHPSRPTLRAAFQKSVLATGLALAAAATIAVSSPAVGMAQADIPEAAAVPVATVAPVVRAPAESQLAQAERDGP